MFPFRSWSVSGSHAALSLGLCLGLAMLTAGCSDDSTSPKGDGPAVIHDGAPIVDTSANHEGLVDSAPKPHLEGGADLVAKADVKPDASLGSNLAASATVAVSFNDQLKGFINDGVLEGDKPNCFNYYYWFSKFPRGDDKWIELSWTTPQTIARVAVDTITKTGTPHPNCEIADVGRTFGALPVKVQVDKGGTWTDVQAINNKTDDWTAAFTAVTTTKLRLLTEKSVTLDTNPIVFEVRVFGQ